MTGRWGAMVLALCAAACAVERTPPGAEVVGVTPVEGAAWPAREGTAGLTVRTVATDPAGATKELRGAACTATSALYAARFRTPARLALPDFGEASPPVEVTCAAGAGEGSGTATPVGGRGLGGWPALGMSVSSREASASASAGGAAASARGLVRYPELRVMVEGYATSLTADRARRAPGRGGTRCR